MTNPFYIIANRTVEKVKKTFKIVLLLVKNNTMHFVFYG